MSTKKKSEVRNIYGDDTTKLQYDDETPKLKQISEALERENRLIDIVWNFDECVRKEKDGGEMNIFISFDTITEEKIKKAAEDIGFPIYIFNMNDEMLWTCFLPSKDKRKTCRYYVTLLWLMHKSYKGHGITFHRVVPRTGCNCCLDPPIVGQCFKNLKVSIISCIDTYLYI